MASAMDAEQAHAKKIAQWPLHSPHTGECPQPWYTMPDSGGTVLSSNNLRGELAAAQAREAAAVEELAAFRKRLDSIECDPSASSTAGPRQEQLRDELRASNEHRRLTQEYAERLQAVVELRDGELQEARSALQLCRNGESEAQEWQFLRGKLHACRAELRNEKEYVQSLLSELEAAGRDKQQLQQSVSGLGSQVAELETMFSSRGPVAPAAGQRCSTCSRGGSSSLPTFRCMEGNDDGSLQAELSRSLQDNVALETTARDLAQEASEALQHERELQEAFFEQGSLLRFNEATASREMEREKARHRLVLERHEAAWREEALVARGRRADLDTNRDVIAELSQLTQASAREAASHEDTACASEKRSHSLELELHAQLAHVEHLKAELQEIPGQRGDGRCNEEFELHVQEVQEIARMFRSEVDSVKQVSDAASSRCMVEAASANRLEENLQACVEEAQCAAKNAQVDLLSKDREIEFLKSELLQMHQLRPSPDSERSLRQMTQPRSSERSLQQATGPMRSITPPVTASVPRAVVRLAARNEVVSSPFPRTTPQPQLSWQAESVQAVHDRLRQRIMDRSDPPPLLSS